jgi:sensor histidine kinase YesM
VHAEPETLDVPVPNFILQPLVENAIRHGVAGRADGGTVHVRARSLPESIQLEVEDDGPGFRDQAAGVGLTNVRDRMRHLYGSENMTTGRAAGGGALVRLTVPRRAA